MSRNHNSLNKRRWAATRRQVFIRDGYRCGNCGKAGRLEAHHEPPLTAGADPYAVSGCTTLCRQCHISEHRTDTMTPGRAEWIEFVQEMIR